MTTIRQPTIDYGVASAQAVLNLLEGRAADIPRFVPEPIRHESVTPIGRSRTSLELVR
jgi:DNA-binding LacI/PurR family transcriptional regulator